MAVAEQPLVSSKYLSGSRSPHKVHILALMGKGAQLFSNAPDPKAVKPHNVSGIVWVLKHPEPSSSMPEDTNPEPQTGLPLRYFTYEYAKKIRYGCPTVLA